MYGPAACIFFGEEIGAVERSEGSHWGLKLFKVVFKFLYSFNSKIVFTVGTSHCKDLSFFVFPNKF